jgi:hypothetical protein
MKKHTWAIFFVWMFMLILAFVGAVTAMFSQERDTVYFVQSCPCDTAFMRRTAARIDRQADVNVQIFNALNDHARAYYILKRRIDSIITTPKRRKK